MNSESGKEEWDTIWNRQSLLSRMVGFGRALQNWAFKRHLEGFLSKNSRLLEIGCGTGSLPLMIADKIKSVTLLDISDPALRIARTDAKMKKSRIAYL